MATYAIGDLQGCFAPLLQLLDKIHFDPEKDQLWFTGDLINRGPASLKTLRFVCNLPNTAVCVLGNHDLTLLAAYYGVITPKPGDTYQEILTAEDAPKLIHWLCQQPLLYHDTEKQTVMTHAGIYPLWDLMSAKSFAREVETALKQDPLGVLTTMFGNEPSKWEPTLQPNERRRFIINAFTRMRFCNKNGNLDFTVKESLARPPSGEVPWFLYPNRIPIKEKIIFGHWAALEGKCPVPGLFAIDTGCVWGNALTAFCLETQTRHCVNC